MGHNVGGGYGAEDSERAAEIVCRLSWFGMSGDEGRDMSKLRSRGWGRRRDWLAVESESFGN